MRFILFISLLALLLLTSCLDNLEDDKQYPAIPIPDELYLATIPMTSDYQYQFYYDLSSNTIVSENEKSQWDLAISTNTEAPYVYLNTANFMEAGPARSSSFEEVSSTQDLGLTFDKPAGNPDSTAIGRWWITPGEIYVINRGIDGEGNQKGYKKVQFTLDESKALLIRHANLDDSEDRTDTLRLQSSVADRLMFSFPEGKKIIEPESGEWDLWFTQYTKMLYADGEPYPYLVVGALSNRDRIEVAELSMNYDSVGAQTIQTAPFLPYSDLIGYDWKELNGDLESGDITYIIRENLTYIVRELDNGKYYKIRFTGFYNESGRKGYPAFEYQELFP